MPPGGVLWIKREESSTGFKDSQKRDDEINPPFEEKRDERLGHHSQVLEVVGQVIGSLIQLLIGEVLLLAHDGDRLWGLLYLRLKQLMVALVWGIVSLGGIPGHHLLLPLRLR